MNWQDVRSSFPDWWLLVEALAAHTEADRRHLDDLAVLEVFPGSREAMKGYAASHRANASRELYVVHTARPALDIQELRWLGIRG